MSETKGLALKNEDIRNILRSYNIGNLEDVKELKRGAAPVHYQIKTTTGRYFLKQYQEGRYLNESFIVLKFLLRHNYPSVRLFDTSLGEASLRYHNHVFGMFEYIANSNKEWKITSARALEIGKYLAKLHILGFSYPYEDVYVNYDYFNHLLIERYSKTTNIPKEIQKALDFIHERMADTKLPADMPKSICHVEFLKRHLIFDGNKLHKILDWDIISKDYMLNDLGTTMTIAIDRTLNYKVLGKILDGYNSERPLSNLEIRYLYEAFSFGVFKNTLWAIYGENPTWSNRQINNLIIFMQNKKDKFDMRLSEQIHNW